MKYGIRSLFLLALVALSSSAGAVTVGGPFTGVWWNPAEPGRGFDVELQGDTMLVTTYIYETTGGDPIWYLSSGTYNHANGTFTSSFDSYSNGQCFGCPWVAPVLHSNDAGPISITFYTNQTATVTYPGGTIDIIKYNYAFGTKTDMLYGEWAFSLERAGVVDGDWIVFDTPYTDSNNVVYASGHVVGAPTMTALGHYDPSTFEVQITVQRGTDTQHLYRFGIFDERRAIGLGNVVTTGQPATDPTTAVGSRLLYKSELASRVIGSAVGGGTGTMDVPPALDAAQDEATVQRMQAAMAEFVASKK